jgi:hypothetical protein
VDERKRPWGLIVGCLVLLVVLLTLTIIVTGDEDSTGLENGLLQFIFFAVSTAVAVFLGYISAKEQAKEIVRPHGRKAVRRIVTLGTQIRSFGSVIEVERERLAHRAKADGELDQFEVEKTLEVLASQLDGQLQTIEDSIEDWRDVVPEEVAALEQRAREAESD